MAKRKALSSPAPSIAYDSDEINVAPHRNIRQKTSHDASNPPPPRRTRQLECVLIPVPTQEESAALLDANTTTAANHFTGSSEHSVIDNEEIKVPAYEQDLVVIGRRSRKPTHKSLKISDFYPSVSASEEVQPQAARQSRPARKSTGKKDDGAPLARPQTARDSRPARKSTGKLDGPLTALLAASSAEPAQQPPARPPTKRANRPPAKSLPTQLPSPEASTPAEECSEDVSRDPSRRPRRSAVPRPYVPEVLESDDELETSAPPPRRRGQTAPLEAESDFEGEEAQEEGSQEEDFTEDEIAQSEESDPEELDSEDGYDSGVGKRNKSRKSTARSRPKPSQSSASHGGTSKTGKKTGKATAKDMVKLLGRTAGEPKGLNTELPPLSSIEAIFKDITAKALSLGLREALKTTPVPLRVATMCSGTESPLLALEMVQDALRSLGASELSVEHLFSAEIVPYKQAYIERNFNPPIIFRDITEITSAVDMEIPVATTVYGSKVPIPGNVQILIAGTSCVDFSRLNKHRKELDEEYGGESSKTWFAVLAYVKEFRPAIVILENVKGGPYDLMMECYREIDYEVGGCLLDTKNYYLPHTRQRGYLVCFDKTKATYNIDGIGKQWTSLMADFRRHASSSVADFMLPNEVRTQQQSLDDNTKEYDWAACEIRHLQYRQDKRLGNARPFTFWSESGTMNVPETGSMQWYHKQPERVRDYMDIGMLRKAALFDVRHKMRIWDVSQNIDMFSDSTQFGITPCITPSGLFFASDPGRALAPQELLSLQGLPLSKISFTTETTAEIQDLAGNAMSTTAVGPAILAALICGQAVLQSDTTTQTFDAGSGKTEPIQSTIVDAATQAVTPAAETQELDLTDLLDRSCKSAKRCYCEGSAAIAQQAIQQCADCHHTTCKRCGGNPSHNYRLASSISGKRSDPVEFERHLRSRLPQCLTFSRNPTVSDAMELAQYEEYTEASHAAFNSTLTFSHVKRSHFWTAIYRSPNAKLELRLDDHGASWRLFGVADQGLPANSELRKLLEQPIAVADCSQSLLRDLQWRQRAPTEDNIEVKFTGTQPIASWLARLALPDYRDQQVWSRLHIQVHVPSTAIADVAVDLGGQYEALPLCGTPGDSLYKKLSTPVSRPIYLLHNPTRDGDPELDRFVFTTEKERLDFGERPVLASLDPKWSPCVDSKSFARTSLQPTGKWQDSDLQLHEVDPRVVVHAPLSIEAPQLQLDCTEAELILKCDFASSCREQGEGTHIVDPSDIQFFAQHAYILELMRRQLPTTKWRALPSTKTGCACSSCAPHKPDLRWKLTGEGKTTTIKPYEDPATAAVYERAIKRCPHPILFQTVTGSRGSTMNFGINLASLAHKAVAHLAANHQTTCRLAWTLEQDMASSANFTVKAFVLRPTEGPSSPNAEVGMNCRLFPKQALVLHWMQKQELGRSFTIEEAEEAIVPAIGWRAEVRAETDIQVRGGICADHPGFGKTITSLALIHSSLSDGTDIAADLRRRQTPENGTSGLIAIQATLIVAPGSLIKQWASEIRDKLGYSPGEQLVLNALRDLDKYTIKDFEKAKIPILSARLVQRPTLGTRDKRFMAAIDVAETAEEALSKDAAFFERQGSLQTGLKNMIETRRSEIDKTIEDLKAACFAAQHEINDQNQALEQMAETLLEEGTLGDEETIHLVKDVLRSTARSHTAARPQKGKANNRKKSKTDDDSDAEDEDADPKESKDKAKGRELTAKVNALAKGLLTSVRSKRYIINVERIRNSYTRPAKCDSQQCSAAGNSTEATAIHSLCGHRVCQPCYLESKEKHITQCAAAGCTAPQHDHHLLWSHILNKTSKASPYGAKLDAATRLLRDIKKKGEKAILFVLYSDQLDQAETALQNANVTATVVTSGSIAGEQIADFCKNNNNDTVLVLNASDETAAGSNIQTANHVIFLSPLLRDSQYGYDSTMAQAVGRVRRHGQKRPIHVYRICALHTIDVDILEHREHRRDALTELNASDVTPPLSTAMDLRNGVHDQAKLERVQLVSENGEFSLRPKSWLYQDDICVQSDEQKMERVEGRDRAGWEDFSSQIEFSRAFAGDE
ncbi:hypothetical protein Q7P36_003613 [Cladosporium allicinum]